MPYRPKKRSHQPAGSSPAVLVGEFSFGACHPLSAAALAQPKRSCAVSYSTFIACCELHRAMALEKADALASGFADALLAAQVKQDPDAQTPIRGSFHRSARRAEPYAQLSDGNVPLITLCQLLETFPNHPSTAKWKEALRLHGDYLLRMSERTTHSA